VRIVCGRQGRTMVDDGHNVHRLVQVETDLGEGRSRRVEISSYGAAGNGGGKGGIDREADAVIDDVVSRWVGKRCESGKARHRTKQNTSRYGFHTFQGIGLNKHETRQLMCHRLARRIEFSGWRLKLSLMSHKSKSRLGHHRHMTRSPLDRHYSTSLLSTVDK